MNEAPQLLRIPRNCHTVDEVLSTAQHLNLQNIVLLSDRGDDGLLFLTSSMSAANANWLMDRVKAVLTVPGRGEVVNG